MFADFNGSGSPLDPDGGSQLAVGLWEGAAVPDRAAGHSDCM